MPLPAPAIKSRCCYYGDAARTADGCEEGAAPLADRVEWAVFSLLSTAGPLSEAAFFERIATLFSGHDLPDEGLVRACLDSYRSMASTPDRLLTTDDLLRRSHEHTDLLATLADAGHRLGMRIWLARMDDTNFRYPIKLEARTWLGTIRGRVLSFRSTPGR